MDLGALGLPAIPDVPEGVGEAFLATRRPGLGEFLGANVREGFTNTTPQALGIRGREEVAAEADPRPLTREEWQASGFARPRLEWDERMTRGRAAAMAAEWDERRYREGLIARRDAGVLDTALGFGAQMLGSIPDPANFVPFAGPVARGLRSLGAVRAADTLAAPGVAAGALRGAVDGTLGNAAVMPITLGVAERYGDEVTFGRVLGELAIGALVGTGFGAVGGLLDRGAAARVVPDTMAAVRTVDAAARDIAAGRPVDVPSPLAVQAVEDALMRSAPAELRGMEIRALPVGPDGLPVTRAEFAAWRERERRTRPVTMEDLDARDAMEARGTEAGRSVEDLLRNRGAARARGEKTLTQFVVEQGGIKDDGGDVRNMLGGASRPGLVNRNGLTPDLMAERARAAGYFDEFGQDFDALGRPTGETGADGFGVVAFLDALNEDVNKTRVRLGRTEDAEARARQDALAELDEVLRSRGLDITAPVDDVLRALRDQDETAPGRTLEDLVAEEEAFAWYREALDARQQLQRLSSAPPAEPAPPPRPQQPARIAATAEPRATAEADPAMAAVEAMRAEGRLTEADEAILRAGDEAAAELEAAARGLTEAGECLLRNLA
jgi:hypothetical protein